MRDGGDPGQGHGHAHFLGEDVQQILYPMLALGAKACLLGRATAYALAADGQQGVENLLDIFAKEMRVAMTLTGVTSIDQIDHNILVQSAK